MELRDVLVTGIAWRCQFCGEWVAQPWLPHLSAGDVRKNFALQVDAHVDFHVDLLVEEIREETSGEVPG